MLTLKQRARLALLFTVSAALYGAAWIILHALDAVEGEPLAIEEDDPHVD